MRQLQSFEEPHSSGPPCLKCGGPTTVSPAKGPHHARIECARCKAWRWLPKASVTRPRKGFPCE